VSHVTRAMILAAGLGTRMAPLTASRPKPLIELRGKPLIDHCIDRLTAGGVNFLVINVHYLATMLIEHLEKRRKLYPKIEIRICDETDAILDTGGAVAKALPLFEGHSFFTQNSDSLWVEGMGSALARMNARWNPETMDCLMLLAPTVTAIGYDGRGDFEMDSFGFIKRRAEMKLAPFVWTGLQIVHPRLFDGAPKGRFSINPQWDKAIAKGRLQGIRLDGTWIHVGTPDGLHDADAFLSDLVSGP
jgi:N-acetyl-alpha-D-muramate 1-phosphate uridylyltransferase